MPLVFVCESFARSGKHHYLMEDIPFIAYGTVQGGLSIKNGLTCLSQGQDTVDGEIYDIADSRWDAFLFSAQKIAPAAGISAKKISAQVRGLALDCYALYLG